MSSPFRLHAKTECVSGWHPRLCDRKLIQATLSRKLSSFRLSKKRFAYVDRIARFTVEKSAQNDEKEGNVGMGLFKLNLIDNQGKKMVDPAGFEPATKGL